MMNTSQGTGCLPSPKFKRVRADCPRARWEKKHGLSERQSEACYFELQVSKRGNQIDMEESCVMRPLHKQKPPPGRCSQENRSCFWSVV